MLLITNYNRIMNRSTKRNVLVFFAVISIACFFLSSCKKPEDRSCFKRSGDPDTLQLNLGEFDKLHLKEHITYYLVQDSVNKVVLHGGKNLLKQVHAAVNTEHGELTLSNENKCRFFRYRTNEIEAYIHFVDLKRVLFEKKNRIEYEKKVLQKSSYKRLVGG